MDTAVAVAVQPPREIPDDVVEDILFRLPSSSPLARAAAASSSLRALVSSPRFLRRHRAHHPDPGPLLAAFSSSSSVSPAGAAGGAFHPADPPHPAAGAARAVAGAADFSFAFLPGPPDATAGAGAGWLVRDHRDGRFLLDRTSAGGSKIFTDLVVCDPLSRRYVLLPPIPEELSAAVVSPLGVLGGRRRCEPFLAPALTAAADDTEDQDQEPSFGVFWTARCPRKVVVLAFSSRDGRWRALPSPECVVWTRHRSPFGCPVHAVWNRRHYAHGCFYWVDCLTHRWLVLDTLAMELSIEYITSPAGFWEEHVAVVEGADGKVGVFAHDFYHAEGIASLHYFTIERDGDGEAPWWRLEKTVQLPWPAAHGQPFCIRGAANGCLILEVNQDPRPSSMANYRSRDVELFKIDVKSFELELLCRARCSGCVGDTCWPYFGFPPLLALPTV